MINLHRRATLNRNFILNKPTISKSFSVLTSDFSNLLGLSEDKIIQSINTNENENFLTLKDENKIKFEKYYEDTEKMKKNIINENRFQSGIYCWIKRNTLEDCYVGQSENLSVRLRNYYSKSVLSNKNISLIHRALVKYGHSNFTLIILEYCEISHLDDREQFYLDNLYSSYNILRFAGSFQGYQKSQENILKFKKSMESLMVVYQLNSSNMYGVGEFQLIKSFNTIFEAAKSLGISIDTISKYTDSGIVYRNKYLFSSVPIGEEALKLILEKEFSSRIKSQNNFVYIYTIQPDGQIQYSRRIFSETLAAKEFNLPFSSFYYHLKKKRALIYQDSLIISSSDTASALPSLDQMTKVSLNGSRIVFGEIVYVYKQTEEKVEFVGKFDSNNLAATVVGCSKWTVNRYLDSGKMYQNSNSYILFSSSQIEEDQLQNTVNASLKSKKLHSSKDIFVYVKTGEHFEFFDQFESIVKASVTMDCSIATVRRHLVSGKLYKKKFIFSTIRRSMVNEIEG